MSITISDITDQLTGDNLEDVFTNAWGAEDAPVLVQIGIGGPVHQVDGIVFDTSEDGQLLGVRLVIEQPDAKPNP